jgi:hypothetical protein
MFLAAANLARRTYLKDSHGLVVSRSPRVSKGNSLPGKPSLTVGLLTRERI